MTQANSHTRWHTAEQEKMARNYQEELEGMNSGYLKLESGRHTLRFLDDGTDRKAEFKEDNGETREVEQVDFRVEYKGEEVTWSATKGKTVNSLYGQIALIGRKYGSLVGRDVEILVQGKGKEKRYTIPESIGLAELQQKPKEETV